MDTGLDHCAGTLIVHVDGGYGVECTDADCVQADDLRHALIVDCTALSGGCGCTASRDLAHAS